MSLCVVLRPPLTFASALAGFQFLDDRGFAVPTDNGMTGDTCAVECVAVVDDRPVSGR